MKEKKRDDVRETLRRFSEREREREREIKKRREKENAPSTEFLLPPLSSCFARSWAFA